VPGIGTDGAICAGALAGHHGVCGHFLGVVWGGCAAACSPGDDKRNAELIVVAAAGCGCSDGGTVCEATPIGGLGRGGGRPGAARVARAQLRDGPEGPMRAGLTMAGSGEFAGAASKRAFTPNSRACVFPVGVGGAAACGGAASLVNSAW